MDRDKEFQQHYAECEKIRSNTLKTASERASAWRQQLLILQHLTSDLPASVNNAVMTDLFSKYIDESSCNTTTSSRCAETLLQGYKYEPRDDDYPELHSKLFEPDCHGFFESCANNGIGDSTLQMFKMKPKVVSEDCTINALQKVAEKKHTQAKLPDLFKTKKSLECVTSQAQSCFNAKNVLKDSTENINDADKKLASYGFRTAHEELVLQNAKKYGTGNTTKGSKPSSEFLYNNSKKTLGGRRTLRSIFVPPVRTEDHSTSEKRSYGEPNHSNAESVEPTDERLRNIDPKMIEIITNEILLPSQDVDWNEIAGLNYAKSIIKEAVVYPLLRPDMFTGLRRPPRGILLFGPPGTGKTMIGRCIASQSRATFFSISASSLTSKWIGEGEKMVRALFAVAAVNQPSVVFIDEIDSLLSQRSDTEHESSRRLKTEFLIRLDGAATSDEDRILIVGATNRPQELDEAARRRFVKRLYIPLPEQESRKQILNNLLVNAQHIISDQDLEEIARRTEGYSGADIKSLCAEASMEPIRAIPADSIMCFNMEDLRPLVIKDFFKALEKVRSSVSPDDLQQYVDWNRTYGATN